MISLINYFHFILFNNFSENETKIEIEIKEDITEKCSQIPEKTLKRNGNSKKQKLTKNKKESKFYIIIFRRILCRRYDIQL